VTYDEFVAMRLQQLLRYAVMLTGDPHLAEDLVQEAMIKVQLKWRRVGATDRPEFYVRRILTNLYIDWRRGPWLRRVLLHSDPQDSTNVAAGAVATTMPDPAERLAERDRVWNLLALLPRRQRAAVVLRYYEDLADVEIAEVLDCAVGTVRAHISRALGTLRVQLKEPTGATTGGGQG
jgi:RNA polymerase sigma-70 factor (sigma-E family)